jgi:hypothetical protein
MSISWMFRLSEFSGLVLAMYKETSSSFKGHKNMQKRMTWPHAKTIIYVNLDFILYCHVLWFEGKTLL